MKLIRFLFICFVLSLNMVGYSQLLQPLNPSTDITFGAGISSYYGDLVQKNPVFREPSLCMSMGLAYNYNPHLTVRGDFSYLQIKAKDSKNSRPDLKARNLSFKSYIWELNTTIEYNFIDITGNKKLKFTPYLFFGVGICGFNPYTTDRFGKKVFLQPMGTEGQGLAAYPDRTPYDRTIVQVPLGGGFKYAVTKKLSLALEFKYRYVDTDYLDDVSNSGYPDKALLTAKDPSIPLLTYRGDEIAGGAPYPPIVGLNRGNPKKRDSYYSAQFRIIYRLKNCKSSE